MLEYLPQEWQVATLLGCFLTKAVSTAGFTTANLGAFTKPSTFEPGTRSAGNFQELLVLASRNAIPHGSRIVA